VNQKILTIAGIIFALIFVGVFYVGWNSANQALRHTAEDLQSLYKAEAPFDVTLLYDRRVSGATIRNLVANVNTPGSSIGFRPTIVRGDNANFIWTGANGTIITAANVHTIDDGIYRILPLLQANGSRNVNGVAVAVIFFAD
jgi:archaellum component FlaF (FlaF/FlaG flagellin family)